MRQSSSPRRLLAAIAVASVAILGLGACSSGDSSSASDGKVTLEYAIWDKNQQPAMEEIAAAFTKEHPDVKINIQLTPFKDYWTKLQTSVSGGSGPDVFWMNGPNFKFYAANDAIAPLGNVTADNYSEGLVDLYTYDGKLYGAPKDFDTIGVWYNKQVFDDAGVAYPKEGWTWDDYNTAAKALTNPEKGIWGSAASLNDQQNYYNTIPQAGGEVISADGKAAGYGSPEALEGINFWVDQIKDGVSPTQQQMTDTTPETMFTSGLVAMYWSGSWSGIAYAENEAVSDIVDVAPLPAGKEGNQSVVHGLANVVNAKAKNPEIAAEFAAFASDEAAANIQAKAGVVIPAYNGTQTAWVDSLPQYNLQVFVDALETAVPYPASENTKAWSSIQDEILAQVWSLSQSPEDGLKELNTRMQAALDAE